jgi:hypothetical protein
MADNRTSSTNEPESVLGSLSPTRPGRFGKPRREVRVAEVQGRGPRPAKAKPARAKAPAPRRAKAQTTTAHKPAAVTAGCPPLERKKSAPPPPRPIGHPKGTELVTTAIQATGELARIGLTVGGQVLKRAVDRLPRP